RACFKSTPVSRLCTLCLHDALPIFGAMGDVVSVKPGYARNYLLPQSKALRATQENIAYFEAQKSALEKANNEKKAVAEKSAKKIDRKSTRLNSSHVKISYAVFCLKK